MQVLQSQEYVNNPAQFTVCHNDWITVSHYVVFHRPSIPAQTLIWSLQWTDEKPLILHAVTEESKVSTEWVTSYDLSNNRAESGHLA